MQCPKCKGLMYRERMTDFFIIFHAYKCINCGALVDATILTNRQRSIGAALQPAQEKAH